MATLWEILNRKKQVTPVNAPPTPVETRYYNPLGLQIGNSVKVGTLDYEDYNFVLRSIREIKSTYNGQTSKIADYDILARPVNSDAIRLRLRLVPLAEPDKDLTHDVLLLKFVADFDYDKDYHDGLAFDKNQGVAQEGDDTFWRVQDVKEPWEAKTASLADLDNSGKVDDSEVRNGSLTYWDFWRETQDADNQKVTEFYFVEMDGIVHKNDQGETTNLEGSGKFDIWRGCKIAANRIKVI